MLKTQQAKIILHSVAAIFVIGFTFLNTVYAETIAQVSPIVTAEPQLLDKSIFKEDEKSLMVVHPRFTNNTTSLILYFEQNDGTWSYLPETIGFGDFNFHDYFWASSPVGKYLIIEYINDAQTFSCYGIPHGDCLSDPRLVSQFNFEIVDNVTALTAEEPTKENSTTPTSAVVTTKKSFLIKALEFFLGVIGVNNTEVSPDTLVTETTSASIPVSDTTSIPTENSDNFSVATSTENLSPPIIVSDTNAPSITDSSVETSTSTLPDTQSVTPSVTGDTNTNDTTTTTF